MWKCGKEYAGKGKEFHCNYIIPLVICFGANFNSFTWKGNVKSKAEDNAINYTMYMD